jgi:5-methylcytosine-specific restriction endonuclease McrBC regulatory subunit McrC
VTDRLIFTENESQTLPRETADEISGAIEDLKSSLRPRLSQCVRDGHTITLRNLIGTVRLPSGRVLEVNPKVPVGDAWAKTVVQLLTDESRIAVTGSQRSQQSRSRNDLTTAIAFEYARRLEQALAKEGPIQAYERLRITSRRLTGRLDVSRWVRSSVVEPTKFPMSRDEFTVGNDFSRGLSLVAGYFRRSVLDASLARRLRRLESAALPGMPLPAFVDPAVASRRLPAQWRTFRPAWDIAAAVLRNRSIVGDPGHSVGLEVAAEPWQLLETLLTRTLEHVGRMTGGAIQAQRKTTHGLLSQNGHIVQPVIPDGVLTSQGRVIASFEAKYTDPGLLPAEAHVYQTIAAAGVLDAPLAILVYPTNAPPRVYDVKTAGGRQLRLATIGLDLFGYRRHDGEQARGERLLSLINSS